MANSKAKQEKENQKAIICSYFQSPNDASEHYSQMEKEIVNYCLSSMLKRFSFEPLFSFNVFSFFVSIICSRSMFCHSYSISFISIKFMALENNLLYYILV